MTNYTNVDPNEYRDAQAFEDEYEAAYRYAKRRPCWICHQPTAWGMCERCSASPDPDVRLRDEFGDIVSSVHDLEGE